MSYNGSGTFQINTSGQPVVAGTVISSTAFNALTADLATGLSTAITKDGQTTTTARIPFAAGINSSLVTDSTNTSTGSIITSGGVGIAKALYVGTTANVAGAVTLQGALGVTGVTTVQAGTALLPAITTTGDTNTGIFFPAADTIAFSEGGVEAARFNSAGNFGLGVTPSTNLANSSIEIGKIGNGLSVFSNTDFRISRNVIDSGANYARSGETALTHILGNGTFSWFNAPAGTAGNAISFTQAMTLNANGVLALQGASTSANGVGITFPATQSASSDVNTLDDYEEGTWTSTLTNCGGSASASGASYVKIGKVVTARLTITSGTFTLNSSRFTLPFSSADLSAGTFSIATVSGGFLEAQVGNICYFATTASGTAYCSITYIAS